MIGMEAFRSHGIPRAGCEKCLLAFRKVQVVREDKGFRQFRCRADIGPVLVQHCEDVLLHEPLQSAIPDEDTLGCLAELAAARDIDHFLDQRTGAPLIGERERTSDPENRMVFVPAGSPQRMR